jgi:pilus assembly protein Flp/PilA
MPRRAHTLLLQISWKGGPKHMLPLIQPYISNFLARFRNDDEEGQTLVEYGLLLALIAIIVIVALLFLGPIVSRIFQNVGTNLNGAGS